MWWNLKVKLVADRRILDIFKWLFAIIHLVFINIVMIHERQKETCHVFLIKHLHTIEKN